MKRIYVDVNAYPVINCSLPATPVVDHKTKQHKADANGEPLYSVELVAYGEDGAEVFSVKFPGTPPAGLRQGMAVKVTGLVVSPWEMDSRHGLSFTAEKIELASQAGQKAGAA